MALPLRFAGGLSVALALGYGVLLWGFEVVPRYDWIVFSAVVAAVFRLLEKADPRTRTIALHVVTQIFTLSLLLHLWTLGYEGRNAIWGGILPLGDSHDFHDDALRLVHGQTFSEVSSKRPLFSTVLAILLRISDGNLRFALVVCAMVGAWATALATLAVWKTHGWKSALVVFAILLSFERRWTGFVQTEHLGMPLGALAFTLVWRAAYVDRRHAPRLVLTGIFAMTLGLMARAGAFFVLPAIVVWATRALVPPDRAARARFVALACGAAVLAFAVHRVVLASTGKGVTFSDYPPIFYGLMHGEDYTYLRARHPELAALPVDVRVTETWRIVLSEARRDPLLVANGFLKSGLGLFTSPHGMFGYVWINPDDHVLEKAAVVRQAMQNEGLLGPLWHWRRTLGTYSLLNAGVMGLAGASFVFGTAWSVFVAFVRRRTEGDLSLLRHAVLGVVASAPFTPPWITSGQQVQTVTLAFVAALPAVVLFGRRVDVEDHREASRERLALAPPIFAAALAVALVGLRLFPRPSPRCDDAAHVVEVFPSTTITVVPERRFSFAEKSAADLEYHARTFLLRHNARPMQAILPALRPGTVYAGGYDACATADPATPGGGTRGRAMVVVDESGTMAGSRSWQRVDGDVQDEPGILVKRAHAPVEP